VETTRIEYSAYSQHATGGTHVQMTSCLHGTYNKTISSQLITGNYNYAIQ